MEAGYFKCANAVFELSVSQQAKLVLVNLFRRADRHGESFPSHHVIKRDCAMSVSAVKRALAELARAGVIEIKTHRGRSVSNLYKIVHGELLRSLQNDRKIAHNGTENSSQMMRKIVHNELRSKTHLKEKEKKEAARVSFSQEKEETIATGNGAFSQNTRVNNLLLGLMDKVRKRGAEI